MSPHTRTASPQPDMTPADSDARHLQEQQSDGDVVVGTEEKTADPYFQNWWSNVIWMNVVYMSLLHGVALYALLTVPIKDTILTHIWCVFSGLVGGFGVTAGAHRLWTHRAFKATVPLRVLLAICFSMAGENTIFDWVRDHRVHHKFSETNADPHNANRGFFFAHMGWLMMKKHPDVILKGRQIDMSDILADPVVQFHTKYFTVLKLLFCFVLPAVVPHYVWGETWYNSIMLSSWRYVLMLNSNWLVNSAAHIWGYHPYDKRINPAENMAVAFLTLGEGWHNYHHVFPWDYRAAELGSYFLNVTTFYLDMFAKIGWAYDLKCPSQELVKRVAMKYGDGSHPQLGGHIPEVSQEEDPLKTVLHPSADHQGDNEDDLDKILSECSTDYENEKDTSQKPEATDTSHNRAVLDSILHGVGKELSHNHVNLDEIKALHLTTPSKEDSTCVGDGKPAAAKIPSFVNETLRHRTTALFPGKAADHKQVITGNFSRRFGAPIGLIKGKELASPRVKPVAVDCVVKNEIVKNEVSNDKSDKCEGCYNSSAKSKNINSSSVTSSAYRVSTINNEMILGNKTMYEKLCTNEIKEKLGKNIH